ncbi:hypothetical protein [Arthrobacter glacialis]|nr:hypothetical protein [Arthrobacter glacialis]
MGEMMAPNPLAPTFMEMVMSLGVPLALLCVLFYSVLRFAVWTPRGGPSLERIRKHALWTGVIAWAFSSLSAAGQAGISHYGQSTESMEPWGLIRWTALLTPVAAVLIIHTIGQATWPAPKSAKRKASLEFRRVRDYVEPALGWTVLGVFLVSAAVMPFVAAARSFGAIDRPAPGSVGLWTLGRVDGWAMAIALSSALVLLAAGTLLVMRLIASRRSLEALSPKQNNTLRVIGMNRLLRVSATVASGLSAIAGNYLVQPVPGSDVLSYTNWLGLVNMAVLVTMLFWKPPTLDPVSPFKSVPLAAAEQPSRESVAAAKLMDSTVVVLIPAMAAGVLLGLVVRPWLGSMGIVTATLACMVLAHLALEWVLKRNYSVRRHSGVGRTVTLTGALPRYTWAAFGLSAMGLAGAFVYASAVATGTTPLRWDGSPNPIAIYWVTSLLAAFILLAGAAAMWFVLTRPELHQVPAALDDTLRRRSLFRIARTVASCWFALAGLLLSMAGPPTSTNPLAPQFDPGALAALCFALSLMLLFLPARGYTPADFAPPAPVQSSNTSPSK